MYLIIDAQYRIYQSPTLSRDVRAQAKAGNLSVVNLDSLKGLNRDGSWQRVQDLPEGFAIDEPSDSWREHIRQMREAVQPK